jgi:hypothetical protein
MLKRVKPTDLLGEACSIDAYGEFLANEFLKRPQWMRKFTLSQYHELIYPTVPLKYCWFKVSIDGGNYASNRFPVIFSGNEHTKADLDRVIQQEITRFFGPDGANVHVSLHTKKIRVKTDKKWDGIHVAVSHSATKAGSEKRVFKETGVRHAKCVGQTIKIKHTDVEETTKTTTESVGMAHSGKHKTGKLSDLAKQQQPPPQPPLPTAVPMTTVAPAPTQVPKEKNVGMQHVVPEFESYTPAASTVDLSMPSTGSKIKDATKEQYYPKREKDATKRDVNPPPLEDVVGNGISTSTKHQVAVFVPPRAVIKDDNELGKTRFLTFGRLLRNISIWKADDKTLQWSVKTGGTEEENKRLLIFAYNETAMSTPATEKMSIKQQLVKYQEQHKTPEIMSRILGETVAEMPNTNEGWIEKKLAKHGTVSLTAASSNKEQRGKFVITVEGDGKTLSVRSPTGKVAHGKLANIFNCGMAECVGATIIEMDTPFM